MDRGERAARYMRTHHLCWLSSPVDQQQQPTKNHICHTEMYHLCTHTHRLKLNGGVNII